MIANNFILFYMDLTSFQYEFSIKTHISMKILTPTLKFRNIINFLILCISILFSVVSFGQTISSFSPTVVTQGTQVIINGTGFTSSSVVKFGGTTAASILTRTATQLRVVVGSGTSGNVTVTNGASVATASGTITYVAPAPTLSTAAVTRVVTDYNGYWTTSTSARSATLPDNRHNLAAFTYNGTLYSTGVNDAILTSHSDSFTQRIFKAFSTDGITGNSGTSTSNYIALGSQVDGHSNANYLSPAVAGLTVRDVLIDGINGLDLGTGVTNVTSSMVMAYKVSNIVRTAINDNEPDVLITQTADPTSVTDVYSFVDADGNIVGNSISANLSAISHVGTYKLDLFTLPNNIPYETAVPNGNSSSNTTREIRLIAFKFSEFGITAGNYALIDKFKLMPGGNSDPAFIAYNASSFLISVPEILVNPISQIICTGTPAPITFSVTATGPDLTYQWKKNNINISGATSSFYTISSPTSSDSATYSVVVSNVHGSVISTSASLKMGSGTSEWNGTAWIGGAPDETKSIVFSGSYTSAGNLVGCNCKVNAGAGVTVLSNHSLTIQNELKVLSGGNFTLNNSASLVQINDAAVNSGIISFIRNTQPVRRYDYTYWSSPLTSLTLFDISPATLSDKYFKYDATINNWVMIPGSETMIKGKGYIARAPQTFSLTSTAVHTATVFGTPNTGVISIPVVKGNGKINLIGNPYPSGLNATLFLNDPANKAAMGGTIYLWTHSTLPNASGHYNASDYAKWNLTGPIKATSPNSMMPTGIIASGQAFFVEAVAGVGTANAVYKNYMRVGSSNNQFFRTSANRNSNEEVVEKHRLWLNLQNSDGAFNQTLVGYLKDATNGLDRDYDGKTFTENSTSLYSVIDEEKLSIQGRTLPFNDEDTVPMGYNATTAGNLSISLDQVDGLFENQNIYLKDNLLNVVHDLKASEYTFATTIGTFNERFEIVYKTEALGVENPNWNSSSVIIYNKNKEIFVNAGTNTIAQLRVIDMQGRVIYENQNVNATEAIINNLPASDQVFIVQVQNAEGIKIAKKIIY